MEPASSIPKNSEDLDVYKECVNCTCVNTRLNNCNQGGGRSTDKVCLAVHCHSSWSFRCRSLEQKKKLIKWIQQLHRHISAAAAAVSYRCSSCLRSLLFSAEMIEMTVDALTSSSNIWKKEIRRQHTYTQHNRWVNDTAIVL